MLPFLRRYWFLLLLTATMVVGISGAGRLSAVADALPRDWIIGAVLFAMALPLRIDTIWSTLRRPAPALLAVAVNSILVPLLAWIASLVLIPDLAIGLIIAAAVPCTLASAAVWTRLAGGNDAMSLLVTMITNLSCFLVTPGWIKLLGGRGGVEIEFGQMSLKLLTLIVLPILAAQALRGISACGGWADKNRWPLAVGAQIGLLTIVFAAAVSCGIRLAEMQDELVKVSGQIALMIALAATVHLLAWWIGYWAAGRLRMAHADQIAVAFAGSQKTLMVGIAIALQFGGLAALPMLAYHFEQLLIDTLLADRLRGRTHTVETRHDEGGTA